MQKRSLPFWLMIVSIATAVLPVWRSPMMSSRWPRPMGTIASIDFKPVCTGCDTFLRQITPGAIFSMTSDSFALIGPLPSIGRPSESTTRPISSRPTGTSRMRPVHLTVSPSVMCSYAPSTTEPTESRSRFSARPKVLPGNSSISPCITSARPWMRQMPSVTEITVPSVPFSAATLRLSIFDLISSLISEGLICMAVPWRRVRCLPGDRRGHLGQGVAHGGVDDLVADLDARPAEEARVHVELGLDLLAVALLERGHDVGALLVVQRPRARDAGAHHALVLALELVELLGDG